jgi:Leucine-rich repeat (LRR) protein
MDALVNLKKLQVSNNKITEFPEALTKLTNLTLLNAACN